MSDYILCLMPDSESTSMSHRWETDDGKVIEGPLQACVGDTLYIVFKALESYKSVGMSLQVDQGSPPSTMFNGEIYNCTPIEPIAELKVGWNTKLTTATGPNVCKFTVFVYFESLSSGETTTYVDLDPEMVVKSSPGDVLPTPDYRRSSD